jgi:chromate reductase, NAD(P)H dehydrogenase (quinone)
MRLIGIGGSLRKGSYNRALLEAAVAKRPPGVEVEWWDGLERVPAYDERPNTTPPSGCAQERVRLGVPTVARQLPTRQANRRDRRQHRRFGTAWAQAELRKVLKSIGAAVLDAELHVPTAHEAFFSGGGLCDPELAATLRSIMHRLVGQTLRPAA